MRLPIAVAVVLLTSLPSFAQQATPAAPAPAFTSTAVFARALDEDSRAVADTFEAQLSRSLIGRGLEVADFAELFPAPPPASIAEGDSLMEQGREAYNNLDPDGALAKFTEAAVFYARHPAETSPEKMARAFIAIGATALLNGQPDRARESFRRALTLQPNIEIETELFGEDVRVGMEQARQAIEEAKRGELSVSSEPGGATVLLDGKELGLTPLPAQTAVVGRHHLIVKRPGFVPFGAFPEVTADKPVELRPVLEPTRGYAEARALADRLIQPAALSLPELPPDAAKLGQQTESRFLVLAAISTVQGKRRADVQAWDLTTGNKLEGLTVDLVDGDWRSTDQLAQQVGAWITNPPPKAERGFAFNAPPLLKKWWFWAAVGGAAAATAGVVAVSQSGGPRPDFIVLGTP